MIGVRRLRSAKPTLREKVNRLPRATEDDTREATTPFGLNDRADPTAQRPLAIERGAPNPYLRNSVTDSSPAGEQHDDRPGPCQADSHEILRASHSTPLAMAGRIAAVTSTDSWWAVSWMAVIESRGPPVLVLSARARRLLAGQQAGDGGDVGQDHVAGKGERGE